MGRFDYSRNSKSFPLKVSHLKYDSVVISVTALLQNRREKNIILYKEPAENSWNSPPKIANTFANRFVIDEYFACEIIGVYQLSNNDEENFGVIHNSLQRANAYRGASENIHFVFARNYLALADAIENMILDWAMRSMKKCVIISLLTMERMTLVSKERVKFDERMKRQLRQVSV